MAGPGMQQIQGMGLQQVLAPQLQQSLQILQAPTLELKNLVQQELQTNPLLEEDPDLSDTEDRSTDAEFQEEFERLAKLDEEWRDYMAQNVSYSARSQEDEERRQFFLDSLANQETLQQHLLEQLNTADIDAKKRKAAELLIGNIDDIGFLSAPLDEIANLSGTPIDDLQEALELVQTFHPVGVGARDLKDCLLIQLRRIGKAQAFKNTIS